jgi:hypothetical protein
MEFDVREPARRRPRLGDPARGGGEVEIHDLRLPPGTRQHLRQLDQRVARAAAGHQRAEGLRPVAPPGEEVMVDLHRVRGRADDQAFRLVRRVALGIGIGLVLGPFWASTSLMPLP